MIAAGLLAIALAAQPAIMPAATRPRISYRIKKKRKERRPPAPPESTRAEPHIIIEGHTVPLISLHEFYRRVGL